MYSGFPGFENQGSDSQEKELQLLRIMQGKGDFLDERVGSILTDLGYTKTRHHDNYVMTFLV